MPSTGSLQMRMDWWALWFIAFHLFALIGVYAVAMKLKMMLRGSGQGPHLNLVEMSLSAQVPELPSSEMPLPAQVPVVRPRNMVAQKLFFSTGGQCVHMDSTCSGLCITNRHEKRACTKCWK
jgi:hypothetical protein